MQSYKKAGNSRDAEAAVCQFLDVHVFQALKEQPYEVLLRGPLKPCYRGQVAHSPVMSPGLIERIVQDPRRLRIVKRVLEQSAPFFASPIYIGMSRTLGSRLARHKALIERYKASETARRTDVTQMATLASSDSRDQSFAREIVARAIPPARLFVMVNTIDCDSDEYVDVENILNRIHFPLLGRN